ncbi:hypothetical protein ABFV83_19255 [Lacrimispora sp. BS-2]|uniref:Uncharacterized protein n=1 Tax=Lacrimispora sp. BS-2 TaxID=3151850 RepID=A0AAU7PNH1_9FIRM
MKRKFLAAAMTFALTAGMLSGCSSSTGSAPENKETQTSVVAATEAAKADKTQTEETKEAKGKGTLVGVAMPPRICSGGTRMGPI